MLASFIPIVSEKQLTILHFKTFVDNIELLIEAKKIMGNTRDLVKKIGDTKGTFNTNRGTI